MKTFFHTYRKRISSQQRKCRWGQAGFTMAELMIVIAIIVILAAFGFVNVIRYQRRLHLQELDDIAEQIFIAAQNHLTASDAAGRWRYNPTSAYEPDSVYGHNISGAVGEFDPLYTAAGDHCYYLTDSDVTNPSSKAYFAAELILPFGAIDDTVRSGGNYVITYDASAKTILSVVYSDEGVAFSGSELSLAKTAIDLYNTAGLGKSQRVKKSVLSKLVGCYGFGAEAFSGGDVVERPVVAVENAEELVLHIIDTPDLVGSELYASKIAITIEGAISKAKGSLSIDGINSGSGDGGSLTTADSSVISESISSAYEYNSASPGYHRIYLDRITKLDDAPLDGGHFADLFPGFIPGEDITISVYFEKNVDPEGNDEQGSALSQSKTVSVSTNSLFRSVRENDEAGSYKASISNGRHLQNLAKDVSNVGEADVTETAKYTLDAAEIVEDIFWSQEGFKDEDKDPDPQTAPDFLTRVGTEGGVSIYAHAGYAGDKTLTQNNQFYSIENADLKSLEGNKHLLAGFDMAANKTNGNAGLFASAKDLTISDLFIINPTAAAGADSGNAGALIGETNGVDTDTVTILRSGAYYGIIIIHTDDGYEVRTQEGSGDYATSAWKVKSDGSDDEDRMITASAGSAGGLIGKAGSSVVIGSSEQAEENGCFAALKISGLNAGGLVGEATGNLTILNSYSGGHVRPTSTLVNLDGSESSVSEYRYDASIWNVTSTSKNSANAAGGLIGLVSAAGQTAVTSCYSTSSAGSASTEVWIGGLVGADLSASSVYSGSYAAGMVGYTEGDNPTYEYEKAGAFAGKLDPARLGAEKNYYLGGISLGASGIADRKLNNVDGKLAVDFLTDPTTLLNESADTTDTYTYSLKEEDHYPAKAVNSTNPKSDSNPVPSPDPAPTPDPAAPSGKTHIGDWQMPAVFLPVKLINGNRLVAEITVPEAFQDQKITFCILGESSSAGASDSTALGTPMKQMVLSNEKDVLKDVRSESKPEVGTAAKKEGETNLTYTVVLDDITKAGGHFANIKEGTGLIPGENIYVFARVGDVFYNTEDISLFAAKLLKRVEQEKAARTDASKTVTVSLTGEDDTKLDVSNSLFGYHDTRLKADGTQEDLYIDITSGKISAGEKEIRINSKIDNAIVYSFRHLENLTTFVSTLHPQSEIKAVQTRDLTWTGTDDQSVTVEDVVIKPFSDDTDLASNKDNLNIYDPLYDSGSSSYKTINRSHNYYPVYHSNLMEYDGGSHTILNTKISDGGYGAGIFSVFGSNSKQNYEIKDLYLKNTLIASSSLTGAIDNTAQQVDEEEAGSASEVLKSGAGTLAGVMVNTNVSAVLSYADQDKYGDLSADTDLPDTGLHMEEQYVFAGGLVGGMKNCTISNSAASIAVQVKASYAGGLAGFVAGGSGVDIKQSYSGGHTVNGKYKLVKNGENIVYNVTNTFGSVGGLVGKAKGGVSDSGTYTVTIQDSYTTCSVSGTGNAGGFIGETTRNVVIDNCYSTGLVNLSSGTTGPFSGDDNFTVPAEKQNYYLRSITIETLKEDDSDTTTVEQKFATGNEGKAAATVEGIYDTDPTDSGSSNGFNPIYRYDNEEGVPQYYPYNWVTTFVIDDISYDHVGDWQESEDVVLVVNTPA